MDELLEYDGLIYSIIKKYPSRFDRDDLYQVGMIGLMDAYKHFDQSYPIKFTSFAYYYIVGEVNKYIRESSVLKVSKEFIQLKKKILETKDTMTQKLGREPSVLEISLFLDVEEEMIHQAILATNEVEDLEEVFNDCKSYDSIDADVLDLRYEIEKLPVEEKRLIKARYYDDLTQRETSQVLGISQVQVSRNETKILQKLKTRL